jgi:hypothetical protein
VQAIGRQPQWAPDGTLVHYERHRPEQTTLYHLVQQHAAKFFAQAEDAAGADLPQFVKDEFDAYLECGILAHGVLRLRFGDRGHDKLLAFTQRGLELEHSMARAVGLHPFVGQCEAGDGEAQLLQPLAVVCLDRDRRSLENRRDDLQPPAPQFWQCSLADSVFGLQASAQAVLQGA